MESAHSLLLNEAVLQSLPESKRDVFIFEWLRFLDRVLGALTRVSTCRVVRLEDLVFLISRIRKKVFSLCLISPYVNLFTLLTLG